MTARQYRRLRKKIQKPRYYIRRCKMLVWKIKVTEFRIDHGLYESWVDCDIARFNMQWPPRKRLHRLREKRYWYMDRIEGDLPSYSSLPDHKGCAVFR